MAKPAEKQEEYFLKVEMVSGRYGRGRDYQTTTFVQNFTSHEEQVLAMQKLFPNVAVTIGGQMVEVGNDGLKSINK